LCQKKNFDPEKCQKICTPADRLSGGPAHQAVKSVGLTLFFWWGQKEGFDTGKWQEERFAPLPAVLFIRRLCGGVAGLPAKLSKV